MNFLRTGRGRFWAVAVVLVALIATFPAWLAFSMFGLKDMGVTARSVRGPIWWGGAEELSVGGVRLGTLGIVLDPFHLLIGQAEIQFMRVNNRPDDLIGAIVVGAGTRGINGLKGRVPLGSSLAPLPLTGASFEDFSARFSNGTCTQASGRVRMTVATMIRGLDLANGLTGEARCDGAALLLPLVSQSGQERLDLRIRASGAYEAAMHVRTSDATLAGALVSSGFRSSGGEQVLRISGTL